ncbi:hypothetical protein TNCV_3721611 [Trichonephila clavipes]|nr:hypothetical protein TNCV_3721611 [Trichonephila clavipes]
MNVFHEVDDVAEEKLCDPAIVNQKTARDTFVAQFYRYHLHGRTNGMSYQGMVLPQDDRVLSNHVTLLEVKTTLFRERLWFIVLSQRQKNQAMDSSLEDAVKICCVFR